MIKVSISIIPLIAAVAFCYGYAAKKIDAATPAQSVEQYVFDVHFRNACKTMLEKLSEVEPQQLGADASQDQLAELILASRSVSLHGDRFHNMYGDRSWEKIRPVVVGMYQDYLKVINNRMACDGGKFRYEQCLALVHLHLNRLGIADSESTPGVANKESQNIRLSGQPSFAKQ